MRDGDFPSFEMVYRCVTSEVSPDLFGPMKLHVARATLSLNRSEQELLMQHSPFIVFRRSRAHPILIF